MGDRHPLDTDDLGFVICDGIAIITLNRPDKANALPIGGGARFAAIWEEVKANPDIRVAIVTGAGEKHFCTGADVGGLKTDAATTSLVNLPMDRAVRVSPHQNKVFKPVIAAVNGLVNGGGLHLVVDADIVVASENAAFMDSHVNVGQVGAIENIGLAKRLPLGTALRMTLQGKSFRLGAVRAHQLGLVDELVATPAHVLPKAIEIATEIARNSPQAVALSKEAIWHSLDVGYTAATEYGWGLIRIQWSHPDFEEGPCAFLERRTPNWNPDPNARRPAGPSSGVK
ncbi:MAG: enoyl-CoA hydratase/isomerase [Bradyrhizobium sp.]|nr:enoyl-CoA hydratase/isomerase [Bradyrhizobium sp.]